MKDYRSITLPSLAILILAAVVELSTNMRQMAPAILAVALTWPAAILTMAGTKWLVRRNPRAAPLGIMAGTMLRMAVAAVGAGVVFALAEFGQTGALSFTVWLVAAYLSTLAVEVFVLAKPGWVSMDWRRKG